MGDTPFGRKRPRLRNVSELFCVVLSVSGWVLVREIAYHMKAGVHVLYGLD